MVLGEGERPSTQLHPTTTTTTLYSAILSFKLFTSSWSSLGFDPEHTTKMFVDAYGPSSSVGDASKLIKYTKELQRVKHEGLPINGPWVNRAVKEFVEAAVKGSKETGVW